MAWQQPNVGMSGGAAGENNATPATEYTLQGVMRFLQLEWHNHERARNAWDIERAEMKAKIAKQEGDVRSAKKLNDQLDKQIRMLEMALKNERAKNKAAAAGAPQEEKSATSEDKKDAKSKSRATSEFKIGLKPSKPASKHHNSFLDIDPDSRDQSEVEREGQRDKTRVYMTKCVEEITYLLTPPAQPPPPQTNFQSLANSANYMNHGDPSLALEDVYLQQRHKMPHQSAGTVFSHPSVMPNHQPPPVPSMNDLPSMSHVPQAPQQATMMTREPSSQQGLTQPSEGPQSIQPGTDFGGVPPEEPVEKVVHRYDSFGRPVPGREEEIQGTRHIITEDPEGWNFDESLSTMDPPVEGAPSRRPDIDAFPSANLIPAKSPPRPHSNAHRRKSSGSATMIRRRSEGHESRELAGQASQTDPRSFKVRWSLRGHLDVVRSVIFTGGGSPSEPEICTAGDDGMIKRWIIPASYLGMHGPTNELDVQSAFTHRGHEGVVTSLAACPASANFSIGGRVSGDGWIFSGGHDATVRVWERGRVDPKATLTGHTAEVWTVCVLPTTCASVFGQESSNYGGPDRILLASGSADGTVKIWAVSAPPQIVSPSTGSRRGVGGSRRHSVTSGSNFPSSPQPSIATDTPFAHMLVHTIERPSAPSPTCIYPLSVTGTNFVVSYSDASIVIYDTRTGEEIIGMASGETYDGTSATRVNTIVATPLGNESGMGAESGRAIPEDETVVHGATGSSSEGGVEGIVISGHEDQYIRFFDANSGQCTYSMLAHPAAITSLALSKDGREAVSAGHDASIRFWSLDKRICTQELTSHRIMRGEGVCSVVWSPDGRLVVSAGGDGVVNVLARYVGAKETLRKILAHLRT